LDLSKKLLKNLRGNLRSTDTFNVLLFSGGNSVMSEESLPAIAENINKAIVLIDRQKGGGGTELLPAMKRALSLKRADGVSRTMVILTDGYVMVEEEVFDLMRKNLGDVNMFAFGIGSSVNRHIIEGMAHVGMGEPFIITKPDEAPAKAERFRAMIQSPVLTGVKASFNRFAVYDVEPVSIPDVLAERPVIVFGKWRGKPQGKITLTGMSGEGKYTDTINVSNTKPSSANSALRYLWARHRVTLLSDYNKLRSDDKRIKEVTDLGLTYNLLTAYTSFVAIDTEVRNVDGKPTTVKQPLPLPEGVSDYAVGGMAATRAYAPMAKLASPAELERKGVLREQAVSKDECKQKLFAAIVEVTISGGLSKEVVAKVVNAHLKGLDACRSQAGLDGKVTVTLTIGVSGVVMDIKVVSGSTKNKTAGQCITKVIKKWEFPANNEGKETKATITLGF